MAHIIDLWTDGSGTTEGNPMGWACILVCDDAGFKREIAGCAPDGTNNRAELSAVIHGLRAIREPGFAVVHTDSEYVMHGFTKRWLELWERRGWRKVKNVDLWKALKAEADRHLVIWEWCRGHDGVELNERADKLAGEARRTQQPFDSGPIPILSPEPTKIAA